MAWRILIDVTADSRDRAESLAGTLLRIAQVSTLDWKLGDGPAISPFAGAGAAVLCGVPGTPRRTNLKPNAPRGIRLSPP